MNDVQESLGPRILTNSLISCVQFQSTASEFDLFASVKIRVAILENNWSKSNVHCERPVHHVVN